MGTADPRQFATISPKDADLPKPMLSCKISTPAPAKLKPMNIKTRCVLGKAPRAKNDMPKYAEK